MSPATFAWSLVGMAIGWAIGQAAALWVIARMDLGFTAATAATGVLCCAGLFVGQLIGGHYGIRRDAPPK